MFRLIGLVFGSLLLVNLFASGAIRVDLNQTARIVQQAGSATLRGTAQSGTYQAEYDPATGRLNP